MNILVTGGTGFTGGHLCQRLVGQGHHVRTLSRRGSAVGLLEQMGVEIIPGDLGDPTAIATAVQGVESIYHIAALYRQQKGDPRQFWQINTEAVEHLLAAAVHSGVRRFVHCSTVGVHGHISQPPATEETPYSPGDLYQESKLAGELIAQRYMREGQIDVTIFRPAAIYGPHDLRFLKLFRAIKKQRFVMLGSGTVTYHLVYIEDLIDGIVACGTQDQAVGQIYILGGETYVPLNQLVAMIAEVLQVPKPHMRIPLWPVYGMGYVCELLCKPLGIEPPLYRRRIDFFKKSRAFDISKAKHELGFRPKVSLKEGLHRTAQWYLEQGYLL
jgi:nucleoside-diphosphate-sugar epimerase